MIEPRRNMSKATIVLVALLLPTGAALADRPGDLAPDGAMLTIGWAGTDALAAAYGDTGLGRITADPSVERLSGAVMQALSSLAEREGGPGAQQQVQLVQQLLKVFAHRPWQLSLIDLQMTEAGPDIQLVLTIDAGESADMLAQLAIQMTGGPDAPGASELTVGDATLRQAMIPGAPLALVSGRIGDHFILASSATAARKGAALFDGSGSGRLTGNAAFAAGRERVHAGGVSAFHAYADVPRIVEASLKFASAMGLVLPPHTSELLDSIGLDKVGGVYLDYAITDHGFRDAVFVEIEGGVSGGKVVSDDELLVVPRDSTYVGVFTFELASWYDRILAFAGNLNPGGPEAIAQEIAQGEAQLGFKIREDLLASLGTRFIIYEDPDMRSLLPGLVLIMEGGDRAKFDRCLERLLALTAQAVSRNGVQLETRQATRLGHEISFAHVGGVPFPVAPAWSWIDSKLVVAMQPGSIEHHLMRRRTEDPRADSILANPDFQRARKLAPANAVQLEYTNVGAAFARFYPLITQIAQMGLSMSQAIGVDADASMLPPPLLVRENLFGQTSSVANHPDGWSSVFHGPLPLGSGLLPGGASGGIAGMATLAGLLVPSIQGARQTADRAVNLNNIKQLMQLAMLYSQEHEYRFPKTIDELRAANPAAPADLFRSLHGEEPYVLIPGVKLTSPGHFVVMYDPNVDAEGQMAVAFAGAEVESLPAEEAWKRINETRRALRLDD